MSLTMDPKQLMSHPPLFFLQNFLGHCGFCMPQRFYVLTRVPGYATTILYAWGIGFKNGVHVGFCKNYTKLYKTKMIKKLGEGQII